MTGSLGVGVARRAAGNGDTASIEFGDHGLAAAVQGREGENVGESVVGISDDVDIGNRGSDRGAYPRNDPTWIMPPLRI